MKILFVCKHNRFRSKVAEAFFNKLNKNKKIKALSAGIFRGRPLNKNVLDLRKKFKIKIKKKTSGLSEKLISKVDLVIIVANNVPSYLFKGRVKKVISWKIPDTRQTNKKIIEQIARQIQRKIKLFVEGLK